MVPVYVQLLSGAYLQVVPTASFLVALRNIRTLSTMATLCDDASGCTSSGSIYIGCFKVSYDLRVISQL